MFGNLCEKLFSVMGDNGTKDFRGLSERFALDAIGFGGFGMDMVVAYIKGILAYYGFCINNRIWL